jgi:hypothetical protein
MTLSAQIPQDEPVPPGENPSGPIAVVIKRIKTRLYKGYQVFTADLKEVTSWKHVVMYLIRQAYRASLLIVLYMMGEASISSVLGAL